MGSLLEKARPLFLGAASLEGSLGFWLHTVDPSLQSDPT